MTAGLCETTKEGEVSSSRRITLAMPPDEYEMVMKDAAYYGAVNLLTRAFHLKEFPAGKGECTVAYVRWVRTLYPGKQIILLWDGASYHRDKEVKALLAELNQGLPEKDWSLILIPFAPNAPDQNPVEDIWLQGKNHLRKNFLQNKTFAAVKKCFSQFLNQFFFNSAKFAWYFPNLQIS